MEWANLLGGLWCRLVLVEEVEKAYKEGLDDFSLKVLERDITTRQCWIESRAKQVAEGTI